MCSLLDAFIRSELSGSGWQFRQRVSPRSRGGNIWALEQKFVLSGNTCRHDGGNVTGTWNNLLLTYLYLESGTSMYSVRTGRPGSCNNLGGEMFGCQQQGLASR